MVDLKGEGVGVSSLLKGRGLSEYAMEFLGKPLDKAEQCSNWSIRPLRQSQLEYAALDAWVLVAIWEHMQIRKADAIRA
jgi:ribonuclease D